MFGVVPKSLWQKNYPVDENNMCPWAMRCLLVEEGNRLVLIDNGMGNKQDAKFFSHYFMHGDDTLDKSLKNLGFHRDDITDVFLTHLHFDHCGGSIEWDNAKSGFRPAFKNATYWSNSEHWKWATEPNPREKASFLKENILPIQESGQLQFVADHGQFSNNINIRFSSGHTDHMMLPIINYKEEKIAFCADLIPSSGHLGLAYVMAYDTRPLLSMSEKADFLSTAMQENWTLYFEHDPKVECAKIIAGEKGVKIASTHLLADLT
jgi:glyoxylase-like metal-dependent hydrolase (beta-lactamase superfamily II)